MFGNLRIVLRSYLKNNRTLYNSDTEYLVYNYTKNKIELVDENDSEDLITLNSIYKIDNLGDLLIKNNEITILNSYARLYKKAIDYIVINLSISDNRELTLLLEELDRKLNYFLVFKVNYDDFIEVFKLKLNEVNYTRKLTIKGE